METTKSSKTNALASKKPKAIKESVDSSKKLAQNKPFPLKKKEESSSKQGAMRSTQLPESLRNSPLAKSLVSEDRMKLMEAIRKQKDHKLENRKGPPVKIQAPTPKTSKKIVKKKLLEKKEEDEDKHIEGDQSKLKTANKKLSKQSDNEKPVLKSSCQAKPNRETSSSSTELISKKNASPSRVPKKALGVNRKKVIEDDENRTLKSIDRENRLVEKSSGVTTKKATLSPNVPKEVFGEKRQKLMEEIRNNGNKKKVRFSKNLNIEPQETTQLQSKVKSQSSAHIQAILSAKKLISTKPNPSLEEQENTTPKSPGLKQTTKPGLNSKEDHGKAENLVKKSKTSNPTAPSPAPSALKNLNVPKDVLSDTRMNLLEEIRTLGRKMLKPVVKATSAPPKSILESDQASEILSQDRQALMAEIKTTGKRKLKPVNEHDAKMDKKRIVSVQDVPSTGASASLSVASELPSFIASPNHADLMEAIRDPKNRVLKSAQRRQDDNNFAIQALKRRKKSCISSSSDEGSDGDEGCSLYPTTGMLDALKIMIPVTKLDSPSPSNSISSEEDQEWDDAPSTP